MWESKVNYLIVFMCLHTKVKLEVCLYAIIYCMFSTSFAVELLKVWRPLIIVVDMEEETADPTSNQKERKYRMWYMGNGN